MVTAFGILIVGLIAGLEGSGFSGLPLTGSLAGSLAEGAGVSSRRWPRSARWATSGPAAAPVAWSSLLAVAGFVRVPAIELAWKCFMPVIVGLVVCTVFAVLVRVARPTHDAAPDRSDGPGLLCVRVRSAADEVARRC